jgi:hypothetical protein
MPIRGDEPLDEVVITSNRLQPLCGGVLLFMILLSFVYFHGYKKGKVTIVEEDYNGNKSCR